MTLILTNHSGATCSVYGYPGLAFYTSGGSPTTTHLTWMTAPHARVMLRPGGNAQAMLTWRVNPYPQPTSFDPDLVQITPPDEYAHLQAAWPGGPVRDGDIIAWPLRAAPAGPFPAGTGTMAGAVNGMCAALGGCRQRRGVDMQPRRQRPAVDRLQRRHAADRRQVPGCHRPWRRR